MESLLLINIYHQRTHPIINSNKFRFHLPVMRKKMGFPSVGYRFNPVEHEIIAYYLKKMIMEHPLKVGEKNVILPVNLYGNNATPWDIFRLENQELPWQIVVDSMGKVIESVKVLYVFTRLSSVGKNETCTSNKNRVAGCGSWHTNSAAEPVRDNYGLGKEIGCRRTFTFQSPEETVGEWTMYEYTIDAAANGIPQGINCQNYALCKLKRDDSKSSKAGRIVSRKRKIGPSVSEPTATENASSGKKKKKRSSNITATSECESVTPSANTFVAENSCSKANEGSSNARKNEGWTPAQETHFVQDAAQETHFLQDSWQGTNFLQGAGQETYCAQEIQFGESVGYALGIEDGGAGYLLPLLVDDPGEVADVHPCSGFQEEGDYEWDPNLGFQARDTDALLEERENLSSF